MESNPLRLYRVTAKYIQELQNEEKGGDKRVYGKDNRPLIGVIVVCNGQKYCVPLTSAKEKFKKMKGTIDFGLITIDDEIIAGIEYSRMIPVEDHFLRPLELADHPHDTEKQKEAKRLRRIETEWCNTHAEEITNKVNVLYNTYLAGTYFKHRKNCLNFPELENVCRNYYKAHPQQHKPYSEGKQG